MDTRRKILSLADAEALGIPVALATGYFDVLRASHVTELQQLRDRARGAQLMVALVKDCGAVLESRSRAELVAALRMVDYVVIANHDELDEFIERLRPRELVRLEEADLRRRKQLIEDVQGRHHQ